MEDSTRHVQVWFNGVLLAETRRAKRVLETSHPPTWYIPPEDVKLEHLRENEEASWCEWKGLTHYYDVEVNGRRAPSAAWFYEMPTRMFEELPQLRGLLPASHGSLLRGRRARHPPGRRLLRRLDHRRRGRAVQGRAGDGGVAKGPTARYPSGAARENEGYVDSLHQRCYLQIPNPQAVDGLGSP